MADHIAYLDNTNTTANLVPAAWMNAVNGLVYRGINPTYFTSTGSANAQVITITGAASDFTTLTAGARFTFIAGYTNSGALTLQVITSTTNAAAAVKTPDGVALAANAVIATGVYEVIWTGSVFLLLGSLGNAVVNGTLAVAGALTLSTVLATASGGTGAANLDALMQYASARYFVKAFTRDLTAATASVAYTGVGFTPKAILVIGCISTPALTNSIGFASTTGAGGSISAGFSTTGLYTAETNLIAAYTGNTPDKQVANVASFDADGFTLTWTKTNSPTGLFTAYAFCIR